MCSVCNLYTVASSISVFWSTITYRKHFTISNSYVFQFQIFITLFIANKSNGQDMKLTISKSFTNDTDLLNDKDKKINTCILP
jgi:hypothetical protein